MNKTGTASDLNEFSKASSHFIKHMETLMRRLLMIMAALMLFWAPICTDSAEQSIHVWAYGCPFAGAHTVTVLMQNKNLFGAGGRQIRVPATVTTSNALEFSFPAAAGPIDVSFMVDGQPCTSGGGGIIVLPGRDRHIVIPMAPRLFVTDWHSRKFFAGALSAFPVSVSIVATETSGCPRPGAPEIPATIDDGAYYASYIKGRHTFLKISSAGNNGPLYIALPDASPLESNNQYVRRDISVSDLEALAGVNGDGICTSAPSGYSTRFDP